ncbi:MAG TPA: type II toxin-antitoxin system mRNA interferase toxin, RelE/StbE family [Candidatus Paceibacterota bacterium]
MVIYLHARYRRSYKNLDSQLRQLADERITLFRYSPLDPRLDTHRLHGKLKKQWSFSVDRRYRVLFEFLDKKKQEVVFLDIGTHSIYQ